MLRVENIIKNYESGGVSFPALKGISLAFRKSEFVSILGPSGCGKTTLLNIIGGLDRYTSGDLAIEGKSTKEYTTHDWDVYRNYRIGFIFQSYNLIPHQNIVENVELALTIAGYSKDEKRKKAMAALDMVGLKGAYKKMPNQLSGGQCQRVAIARALVNEPDILLGDEPTGALDSKTSVQVMKLIKKISKTKLVIMVTHNPPLAKEYSTRIISFLDGRVVGDTNPYKIEDEKKEKYKTFEGVKTSGKSKKLVHPSRAKMSFWDAFKLSAKNLISKKKRTMMVIAASSIGIVGVSAVLAVSSGVKGYIATTQKDMLSGNPLNVSETSVDLVSILQNVSSTLQRQAISDSIKDGYLDIEYLTGALITQAKEGVLITNDITDTYVDYIEEGKANYANGIADTYYSYGYSVANNIYAEAKIYENKDHKPGEQGQEKYIYSLSGLKNIYTGILGTIKTEEETDFTLLANVAANFPSVMYQGLDNQEYLKEQYDLVATDKGSRWPNFVKKEDRGSDKDYECVVVLNRRKKLADLIVTLSGLLDEKDFLRVILEFIKTEPDEQVIKELSRKSIDNIIGKTFYYIPNGKGGHEGAFKINSGTDKSLIPFNYNYKFKKDANEEKFLSTQDESTTAITVGADSDTETKAKRIKVVGIITPKEGRNYGSLTSGIYFQSDLANKMMEDVGSTDKIEESTKAQNSDLYNAIADPDRWITGNDPIYSLSSGKFTNAAYVDDNGDLINTQISGGLIYPLNFARIQEFKDGQPIFVTGEDRFKTYGTVGESATIKPHNDTSGKFAYTEISSSYSSRSSSGRKIALVDKINFKHIPSSISIYSRDFQTKDAAKKFLEVWNSNQTITVKGKPIEAKARSKVTVPDNLTIIITMINGIITTTTISLTIFASLSLVVSTVMIGIITYISVMERIKEIGVIRSLGGRKKDVSHLFNAETFILGTISGVFGILVTYIFELILDIAVYNTFRIPMIADLKWYTALIMIILSIVLTAISGLIPASSAANKDPVNALRSE